jgi:hypothetical protein
MNLLNMHVGDEHNIHTISNVTKMKITLYLDTESCSQVRQRQHDLLKRR